MRITEVAEQLKVHRGTVKRWVQIGRLKATMTKPKWGGHPYYDVTSEDLQNYLNSFNKQ